MSWILLQRRFSVARPPLSFRPNVQDVSAFTEDNRDLRRQTRKADDIYAIRGRWSKRRWRTNPRHLFRYCDATLHVRDFSRIAAVAEAAVRCTWAEKAQAMKEVYDGGFQHPGRSTLLRSRKREDITSMHLRRRWFNSDRWHSQPRQSLHLQVDASLITGREVFGMVWDTYSVGSSWLLSLMPLVLLGYGHVSLCRQDNAAVAITVAFLRRWCFQDL